MIVNIDLVQVELRFFQAPFLGQQSRLHPAADVQLLQNIGHVVFDGLFGQVQFLTDFPFPGWSSLRRPGAGSLVHVWSNR
jgi:hypothetical protein